MFPPRARADLPTKAIVNLQDICVARGATGALVGERIKMWMEAIPRG
ncbi:MAG TPA: hypothetical protein VGE20_14800 [Ramlibacter sp.]